MLGFIITRCIDGVMELSIS